MTEEHDYHQDIIDTDLYEEIDDEELIELVEIEKQRAILRSKEKENALKLKPKFPRWLLWLLACAMLFQVIALIPKTFSIPAIDFLITSAKLSLQSDIQTYKESVVVVRTDDSKGTGFSISADGTIVTNYHVVQGNDYVKIAFPDDGLFKAEVAETYPEIDLAVLSIESDNMDKVFPYLHLARNPAYTKDEKIYFIGNPLSFSGIANKGTIIEPIRLMDWEKPVYMIDAPVYHGNSGSPVINMFGDVIGVVFATLKHDDYGKVGLFIPIDYLHENYP